MDTAEVTGHFTRLPAELEAQLVCPRCKCRLEVYRTNCRCTHAGCGVTYYYRIETVEWCAAHDNYNTTNDARDAVSPAGPSGNAVPGAAAGKRLWEVIREPRERCVVQKQRFAKRSDELNPFALAMNAFSSAVFGIASSLTH